MKTKQIRTTGILMLMFLFVSIMLSGCEIYYGEKGNGNVIKEDRKISSFNAIEVSGAFDVHLTQGSKESLVVEADENLMGLIITEIKGGKLKIYTKENIKKAKELNIYLTFVNIDDIDISGAVELESENKLKFDDLKIESSGASEIELELRVNVMEIETSGASEINLRGKANIVNLSSSGASEMEALDLETATFNIDISGAGEAKIFVIETLNVDVSGAASIRYKGDPTVSSSISGAGSVRKY